MSINLEESFKTHCNIQKLEINPNQIMRREFASEFEPGECWGYNKYCRIDELV